MLSELKNVSNCHLKAAEQSAWVEMEKAKLNLHFVIPHPSVIANHE
jgi:hypothetical protein